MLNEPVTVVITRRVKPGFEAQAEAWIRGVHAEAKDFAGHMGLEVIRPFNAKHPEYVLIFRFDNEANLHAWEHSEARQAWLHKAEEFMQGEPSYQRLTGLEYWFSLPANALRQPPPRWKMVMVTWLAIFPVVLVVPPFVGSLLVSIPPLLRTFMISGVMVGTMSYLVMPIMTRLWRWWLYPR